MSKPDMYEFWYDYIKEQYGNNAALCYIDIDNFIIHIKLKFFQRYLRKKDSTHQIIKPKVFCQQEKDKKSLV